MGFSLKQSVKKQWQLSLLFILFLPFLLRLGVWQLERAEEKQKLLLVYQQQRNLPAKRFDASVEQDIEEYQPITVRGEYDKKRYWLLDNKPRDGKVGYEVVMPLWVESQWVLVNRGWLIAPIRRTHLPNVETPKGELEIQGYFYQESKNAIVKNTNSDYSAAWPKRVLQLDITRIRQELDGTVYPDLLRIDDNSPSAFLTQWPLINTRPEKHFAYAVQWFIMAFVLVGLYGWALFKK